MTDVSKEITFLPSGRGKARCAADPAYPQGIELPKPPTGESCFIDLPYPAPECGMHLIRCHLCGSTMAVTAAGRPDDPVSCYMPCHLEGASA